MKLNLKAFALTCAIVWGASIFIITWWSYLNGGGKTLIALARIYKGYSVTPLGSVIGLVYAFVAALGCGAFFAWLYNKLSKN